MRIIVEQSIECNSSLYVNFVDYEKAFDSLYRESLWKILRHYGVPMKLVNMMKNSYEGMSCRVIHDGQLTKNFEIRTGVRQGCLLSPIHLQNRFTIYSTTRSTRRINTFVMVQARTNIKAMCLSVYGVKLWNSLPNNLRDCNSVIIFKKKLTK